MTLKEAIARAMLRAYLDLCTLWLVIQTCRYLKETVNKPI